MNISVLVNYPEYIDGDIHHEMVKKRVAVWLNRIEQKNGTLQFDDINFINLSANNIQSSKKVYDVIRNISSDIVLYFFSGTTRHYEDDLLLNQNQSSKKKERNSISVKKVLQENDKTFFFCDVLAEKKESKKNIKFYKNSHLFIKKNKKSNSSFLDRFIDLNNIRPYFYIGDILRYLLEKFNIKNDVFLDHSLENIRISSFKKSYEIWYHDSENFGSDNKGSREDGIQTLKFLSKQLRFAKSAKSLLKYFKTCDPEFDVRNAANRALSSIKKSEIIVSMYVVNKNIDFDKNIGPMVLIPAGYFIMGSDPNTDENSLPEEQPRHKIYLDTYKIQKSPVNIKLFRHYLLETGKNKVVNNTEYRDYITPVTNVTWYEAIEFCIWLNSRLREKNEISDDTEYRLPTEAEWEKAARGEEGTIYPWGNTFTEGTCNYRDLNIGKVVESGSYSPKGNSPYGIWDMAGNSWDWTISNWGEGGSKPDFSYPYISSDGREDILAGPNVRRVIRGGAYYYWNYCLRNSTRNLMFPDTAHTGGGFRLVKSRTKHLSDSYKNFGAEDE